MDAIFGSFSVRFEICFTSQKLKYEYLKYDTIKVTYVYNFKYSIMNREMIKIF